MARECLETSGSDVCFWHKADITTRSTNVRFWGQSGHCLNALRCLLLTQSGHEGLRIAAVQTGLKPHFAGSKSLL
jgi:hypothetical protein